MRIERLDAERLTLRPLSVDDAADLFLVYGDPEAMRFWTTPAHPDAAETARMIDAMLSEASSAWWSIVLRASGRAIGAIGLYLNASVPGIGYILGRAHWRQGYGAEALRAVVDHTFNDLGRDRVELWIQVENVASRRLAEKTGFTRRAQFRTRWAHNAGSHVMAVYGLHARDWPSVRRALAPRVEFSHLEPILSVPDVSATAAFYRDKLGFTIEFLYGDPPVHAGVARGEWSFPSARLQLTQAAPGAAAGGLSLFVFVGPDIERLRDEYARAGVEISADLETKPWGMREFSVRDCNGYVLRFGTPG